MQGGPGAAVSLLEHFYEKLTKKRFGRWFKPHDLSRRINHTTLFHDVL